MKSQTPAETRTSASTPIAWLGTSRRMPLMAGLQLRAGEQTIAVVDSGKSSGRLGSSERAVLISIECRPERLGGGAGSTSSPEAECA